MLLALTTTLRPATDLGDLLHKNPARAQVFDLAFGRAHVFYPEAAPDRCTAALLLDVDGVGLVRGRHGPAGEGGLLQQYVNDRPYVASSFLSVALNALFGSALGGRSKDRQELADRAIPLDPTTLWRPRGLSGDGTLTDPKHPPDGTPLLGIAPVDLGMRVLVGHLVRRQREGNLTERGQRALHVVPLREVEIARSSSHIEVTARG